MTEVSYVSSKSNMTFGLGPPGLSKSIRHFDILDSPSRLPLPTHGGNLDFFPKKKRENRSSHCNSLKSGVLQCSRVSSLISTIVFSTVIVQLLQPPPVFLPL